MNARRSGGGGPSRGNNNRKGGRGRRPNSERGSTPNRPGGDRRPGSSKGAGRKGLGGDHVEGRHAVRELLLAGRRPVREILLAAGLDPAPILDDIVDLADETRTPIREIGRGKFDLETRTEGSQGIIARAAPIEEVELDDLLSAPDGIVPFLLALDGVTDPGNVGALLRTAECAGVTGVVFPRHRAAHITPTVTKTAQGAVEHLPMTIVGGLPAALTQMVSAGIWTVGLDGAAEQDLFDLNLKGEPVCLVVGAEGKGLSRLVRERVDAAAALPLKGVVGSLNVSAAGAVAMYEVSRHR